MKASFANEGYVWSGMFDWCTKDLTYEDAPLAIESGGFCRCENTKWLLDDPATWPSSFRLDLAQVCQYTGTIGTKVDESSAIIDPGTWREGDDIVPPLCAVFRWDLFDLNDMIESGTCLDGWMADYGSNSPCQRVKDSTPGAESLCFPEVGPRKLDSVPWDPATSLAEEAEEAACGCGVPGDFTMVCSCPRTVDRVRSESVCECTGTCPTGPEREGPPTFRTTKQHWRTA